MTADCAGFAGGAERGGAEVGVINMHSAELETLDQLLGGDIRLGTIAALFPSREEFSRGVLGLLSSGDVILLTLDKNEVPRWRWSELFSSNSVLQQFEYLQLRITPRGARRIG